MFSVTILGRASAKPTKESHASAQIVNLSEQYYLVDAGEGVQQQLFRYGFNPLKIRAVFISHLHGDHVFGLFPLLSTMGLYGRQTALKIFAPHPFRTILESFLNFFEQDLPYKIEVEEVDTTAHRCIFENRTMEVWSIPLRHRQPCAGFHFREKEPPLNVRKEKIEEYNLSLVQVLAAKRGEEVVLDDGRCIASEELTYSPFVPASYAYLSDTARSAVAARRIKGVDLLYHEATYCRDMAREAKARGHSTTADAADVATKAEAKKLIIGHFSSRYRTTEGLEAEVKSLFPQSEVAQEGETYVIR